MGCESSLIKQTESIRTVQLQKYSEGIEQDQSRNILNLSFTDFIKGNSCQIFQQYVFKGWINKSQNSIMRWVEHKRSQIERVVKIIKRNNKIDIKIMKEINVLKKLDHPNIVKLHQYFIDVDYVYMIFQPIYGQRIFNHIVGIQEHVLRNLRQIMKQLLQAIQYCHTKGVIHMNITPQNLMLVFGYHTDKQKNQTDQIEQIKLSKKVYLKIVGFGGAILNEKTENQSNYQNTTYFNTRTASKQIKKKITEQYMSPQVTTTENAHKQDIWSCGIIMQNILQSIFQVSNLLQFDQNKIKKLVQQKSKSIQDAYQSIDLLKNMLNKNPYERFSAQQCLNHPYFYNINKCCPWKITQTFRSLHAQSMMVQSKEGFEKQNKIKDNKQIINRNVLYKYLTMYLAFKQPPHVYHSQFITQFYNLDKNKDGMIQYNELLEGLQNFFKIQKKSAKQYISQIFENLDKNSNGCIEYSQFVMGTLDIRKIMTKKSLMKVFQQIDKNQDGYIDQKEIQQLFGIQASSKIFRQNNKTDNLIQLKKNHKISFEQFQELIAQHYNEKTKQNNQQKKSLKSRNLPPLSFISTK